MQFVLHAALRSGVVHSAREATAVSCRALLLLLYSSQRTGRLLEIRILFEGLRFLVQGLGIVSTYFQCAHQSRRDPLLAPAAPLPPCPSTRSL